MNEIDGVMRLPHDLWLEESCAGRVKALSVGPLRAKIALPRIPATHSEVDLSKPRALLETTFGDDSVQWPAGLSAPTWGHQIAHRRSILVRAARLRVAAQDGLSTWQIQQQLETEFPGFFSVTSDLSFASDMGPPSRQFCQRHGTTRVASHGTTLTIHHLRPR